MSGRYGYSLKEWEETKEEIRKILIARAKTKCPIFYSELANQIKTVKIEYHARAFHEMLGEISIAEDNAGRGLLSALVIHKEGNKMPGQGFFNLAKERGKNFSDNDDFWIKELNSFYSQWK